MTNLKPALVALGWMIVNLVLYHLMMEANHEGSKPIFIFFRILLMISVIMQALVAIGIVKVTSK